MIFPTNHLTGTSKRIQTTSASARSISRNMAPAIAQKLGHPGAIPPKWETCPRSGRTDVQNFTLIGKAPAEKSVTVHKKINSKPSIPHYVMYSGITTT